MAITEAQMQAAIDSVLNSLVQNQVALGATIKRLIEEGAAEVAADACNAPLEWVRDHKNYESTDGEFYIHYHGPRYGYTVSKRKSDAPAAAIWHSQIWTRIGEYRKVSDAKAAAEAAR